MKINLEESDHSISSLIDRHHESLLQKPRPHLGASLVGHPCTRWVWLSFRWAVLQKHEGRMLRLFRRGQREEEVIIQDLRAIGMQIGGTQDRVNFGCHVSGSVDCIIESGVPEAPKKRHVGEFKTHNKKSFDDLIKHGVQEAKPEHYAQMQIYMHGTRIDRALYVAVCKDDDRLHTERVRYDQELADRLVRRAQMLAIEERIPPPISSNPAWYQCRYCPAHDFCHVSKTTKEVNCRTCAHSTPRQDSTWTCERHGGHAIPVDFQRQGCDSHVLHPDLVPWKIKDSPWDWVAVYEIDGRDTANGEADAHVYSSKELLANPIGCSLGSETVAAIRTTFGARIAGGEDAA